MTHGTYISPDDCAEIRRRSRTDEKQRSIADALDTTVVTVRNHAYGRCTHSPYVDEPALAEPDGDYGKPNSPQAGERK